MFHFFKHLRQPHHAHALARAGNGRVQEVAVHQQMGYCQHISAGDFCWLNRIIMAVPCVWYCGWVLGLVLVAFALFGLLHATIGWVFTIPTLSIDDEDRMIEHTDIECGLLLPMNLICVVFVILSFFFAPFRSVITVLGSASSIIVVLAVLAIGTIIRMIVLRKVS